VGGVGCARLAVRHFLASGHANIGNAPAYAM
jgi:hypothetical protein